MTVDELHTRLRRKVDAIFANEVLTDEDRAWRKSALIDAYVDFGERADLLRGIQPRTAA